MGSQAGTPSRRQQREEGRGNLLNPGPAQAGRGVLRARSLEEMGLGLFPDPLAAACRGSYDAIVVSYLWLRLALPMSFEEKGH